MNALNLYEVPILDWIRENLSNGFLDMVMPVLTKFADAGIGWIAIALVLLFFKRTRPMGITMGIALLAGVLIGNLTLKPLVARIRPYDVNNSISLLIEKPHDYSFPSGHTLASFEAAMAIFLYHRKWGIAALVMAALVAFSRMYLYVHYPSDILAGIILGVIIAFAAHKLYKWIETFKTKEISPKA